MSVDHTMAQMPKRTPKKSAPTMIAIEITIGARAGTVNRSTVLRTAVQLVAIPVMRTIGRRP